MNAQARRAIALIRQCVEADRFMVLPHFRQRMTQRGLVWPDVLAVLDNPADVRAGGADRFGRAKWIITGTASDGLSIEIVCVLDVDDRGDIAVFITIY